jgi:hypothetical protein
MKRAIAAVATTLILTAGQAMAEGVTPPRQVNGLSLIPWCYCTCLDYCCPKCPEDGFEHTDSRPNKVGAALFHRLREPAIAMSKPTTERPK